jgi:E3 ubiquitin-protein ligase SHPRH
MARKKSKPRRQPDGSMTSPRGAQRSQAFEPVDNWRPRFIRSDWPVEPGMRFAFLLEYPIDLMRISATDRPEHGFDFEAAIQVISADGRDQDEEYYAPTLCSALFLKHWMPSKLLRFGRFVNISPDGWMGFDEYAHDDTLLSVLLLRKESELTAGSSASQPKICSQTAELTLHGCNIPLCMVQLIESRALRITYSVERASLLFALCLDRADEGEQNTVIALSHVIRWVVNQECAAGEFSSSDLISSSPRWVYDVVRRSVDDDDSAEQTPFLKHAQSAEDAITVPIRSYQRRAVAWMLSREIGPPISLGIWIPWEPAARFLEQVDALESWVTFEPHFSLNPVYGQYRVDSNLDARLGNGHSTDKESADQLGRGGLLCDAMGLGKTIELILLVVSHQAPQIPILNNVSNAPDQSESCCECNLAFGRHLQVKNQSWAIVKCIECDERAHLDCSGTTLERVVSTGFVCSSCCERIVQLGRPDIDPSLVPQSRATIIVVPTALLHQWRSEIEEHVHKSVRIVVFEGLNHTGYIRQRTLLDADIVLTTYDALGSDVAVARAFTQGVRILRHPKRYRLTPTPLLSVKWWRLALDEAQMLGLGTVAEMACNLKSRFRWCVSGTPFSQGVTQIMPMMRFLRLGEDCDGDMWLPFLFRPASHGLMQDQANLRRALRLVMWRTESEDVEKSELCLPQQTRQVVRASLGPVEKYHYRSLYNSVRSVTLSELRGNSDTRTNIASDLLVGLRQACCHPQVGASGRRSGLSSCMHSTLRKEQARSRRSRDPSAQARSRALRPLTMEEVLEALVVKSRMECQEALRVLVASSNGLAGISMLEHSLREDARNPGHIAAAVGLYRNALRVANENQCLVKIDSIQRMHILHNLSDSLGIVRDLRKEFVGDEDLLTRLEPLCATPAEREYGDQVSDLKSGYIADARTRLEVAMTEFGKFSPIDRFHQDFVALPDEGVAISSSSGASRSSIQWWERALAIVVEFEDTSFLDRVIQALLRSLPRDTSGVRTIANRIGSVMSLHGVLSSELSDLMKARKRLRSRIYKLPGAVTPSEEQVSESGQCRNCREVGAGPPCAHCRSEHVFIDVDRKLYSLRESISEKAHNVEHEEPDLDEGTTLGTKESGAKLGGKRDAKSIKAAMSEMFGSGGRPWRKARNDADLRLQGEVETVMRVLASVARSKGDHALQKEMDKWFRALETMKKEHVAARKVFDAQKELLGCLDEANMALMRLSLLHESEDASRLTEHEKLFRLPPSILPSLRAQFSQEKAASESDFRTKRGSLVYLTSLKSSMDGDQGSDVRTRRALIESRCPVCLADFDTEISILTCGHAYCFDCTLLLIRNVPHSVRVQTIVCPECRVRCRVDEINFTTIDPNHATTNDGDEMAKSLPREIEEPLSKRLRMEPATATPRIDSQPSRSTNEEPSSFLDDRLTVIGSIGSKMEAIVRVLKSIDARFPGAKSLVFSQWTEVLEIVSSALTSNRVAHINGGAMQSSTSVSLAVATFKQSVSCNVLLLPLRRAGAGLNLTEATHVLLVEPSLNPALEAQAVSRVHRIGQTQLTFVHRFIMNDTIEDKVLEIAAGRSKEQISVAENVTATDFERIFAEPGQRVAVNVDDEPL